ncbi:MAG: HD-GYP domain-containing protein [Dehalococcoidia bacterium]
MSFERSTPGRNLALAAGGLILASPLLALAVFKWDERLDPEFVNRDVHFWAVGVVAIAAAVAAALVIASAQTLRGTRLLFLALAFLSIAATFSVHGLATPGFILHSFHSSVSVSSWVSISLGAFFVALSAMEMPERVDHALERAGGAIFAWVAICLTAYVALSLTAEGWLDSVPTNERPVQYAIAIATLGLYGFAIWRYTQAYLFARLISQAAMIAALVLLAEVQVILLYSDPWYTSWWIYHALYGVALVVLFGGWAIEARRAGSLRAIADALAMRDALAQLNRGRDTHMLELVDAIEAKDRATLGHVSRVASVALGIGKKLHLSPQDMRALGLAAQMHDVGKIGVPDAILRKPSKLTDEEYAEVKRHSNRGDEIARRVDTLRALAPVIRAHHERLDGSGYPDGLRGEAIPLLARIVAVADTYDAITSTRPYRPAMTHEQALAELRRVRGIELDARCVDALLDVFAEEHRAAAA